MGCGALEQKEALKTFGLQKVHIIIEPEHLGELNSTVWNKRPVPAQVIVNDKQFKAKIAYAGASTIDDYKKSIQIHFEEIALWGHSQLRLSAQSQDPTLLRSLLGFELFASMGLLTPKIEPTALHMNHEYAGLYQLIEPVNMDFFQVRHIPIASLYKSSNVSDFSSGGLTHRRSQFKNKSENKNDADLRRFIEYLNQEDRPDRLGEFVDFDNYQRYLVAAILLDHFDGFTKNFFIYRAQKSNQFYWVPWDLDRLYEDHLYLQDRSIWGRETVLSKNFFKTPSHRQNHLRLMQDGLNTWFHEGKIWDRLSELETKITQAYHADPLLSRNGRTLPKELDKLERNIDRWLSSLSEEIEKSAVDIP